MTALNFMIQKEQVCFAIDSLAISTDDHLPYTYLTKFIILPHLSTVVTGTGNGLLVAEWMNYARSNIIAKDIDHFNNYAPDSLSTVAKRFPELDTVSTTIYHFGYS